MKRLFPKVAPEALGWKVDASHWPSTVYVAAVPWIQRVVEVTPDQARDYATAVRQCAPHDAFPMQHPPFPCLDAKAAGDFPKLDGNYLHREFVTSARLCQLADDSSTGVRDRLDKLLQDLYAATDRKGTRVGQPPVFYALLLADGDHLGKLVSGLGGAVVSNALASFTGSVPRIVEQHRGVTVYAGGDDVLAMLPVPDAQSCASDAADAYRAAFAGTAAKNRATISVAVVFAHVRLPLRSVLDEAHRLLDAVAKDGNGRNSLAAAVLKPGGRHCQWVTSWTRPAGGETNAATLIGSLVRELSDSATEAGLSGSLIYRLRETLTALCGWERWQPGTWGEVPADLRIRPFLHSDVAHSLKVRMGNGVETRAVELTDRVCAMLGRSHATEASLSGIGIDALLLARFLADPQQQESDR